MPPDDTTPAWYSPPNGIGEQAHIIIVGAGLAGCTVARALCQAGRRVTLLDRHDRASQASSNPTALLRPHPVKSGAFINQLQRAAYQYCLDLLDNLEQKKNLSKPVNKQFCGVIRLVDDESHWQDDDHSILVTQNEAAKLAAMALPSAGLYSERAGWVDIGSLCDALISSSPGLQMIEHWSAHRLSRVGEHWQLSKADGTEQLKADAVVLAGGATGTDLLSGQYLPLQLSSGQLTICTLAGAGPDCCIAGKRFLIPEAGRITIGATHHRNNRSIVATTEADEENLNAAAELLQINTIALQPIKTWRSVRASTADRLPVVGGVPDTAWYQQAYQLLRHGDRHRSWPAARYHPGLFMLTGLGSRGLLYAPLCAEILASQMLNRPAPVHRRLLELLHPARFAIRNLRRGRPITGD